VAEARVISSGVPPLTIGDAAQRVLQEQARTMRRYAQKVRRGKDPEDVHQMRVASRRLRAVLRELRSHLVVDPRIRRGLRWLAGRLGAVRDTDVILALLEEHRGAARGVEAQRHAALVAELERRRGKARRRLRAALAEPRYRRLTTRLRRSAAAPATTGQADATAARVLTDALERMAGELERHPAMAATTPSADELHALRIAFKRTRYVLDLHAAVGGPAYDVERRLACELQDVLGALHDHDLLLGWLAEGQGAFAGPWPVLEQRLTAGRRRLLGRFRRLRKQWRERTRADAMVAPLAEPRFVHLEPRPMTLRLVAGGKNVASEEVRGQQSEVRSANLHSAP
jgi:CHAD domain-containing protein